MGDFGTGWTDSSWRWTKVRVTESVLSDMSQVSRPGNQGTGAPGRVGKYRRSWL